MTKSKMALICAWFSSFMLSVFLILIIPENYTSVVITALVFDGVAFLSQFILWLKHAKEAQSAEGIFQKAPIFSVSCAYLAIEFAFSLICAAFSSALSFKAVLIINVCIFAVVWVLICALIGSKSHIQQVESRQKNNHVEL